MTHKTQRILMTAAAGILALTIAVPAMAEDTASPPQGQHHGMRMDGHSDMTMRGQSEKKPGTDEQKGDMAEHCRQMMEAMSQPAAPPAEPSEPKSKPGGC